MLPVFEADRSNGSGQSLAPVTYADSLHQNALQVLTEEQSEPPPPRAKGEATQRGVTSAETCLSPSPKDDTAPSAGHAESRP